MGARLYVPILGRFLTVDPIKGGTQNDYVYPSDPVNSSDFSGTVLFFGMPISNNYRSSVSPKAVDSTPITDEQASFIPVAGVPISLKMAWNDAKSGNWWGAALNAAGVFPMGKYLGKGGKAAMSVVKGTSAAAKVEKFTASNFRSNLIRATGSMPVANQAHHVLPQKFNSFFDKAGINIHDPKFGMWVPETLHLKNSSVYNSRWAEFIRDNGNASQAEIFDFARRTNREVFDASPGF